MQTSSAGLNRNVRGAPVYCAWAAVETPPARDVATARQANFVQIVMFILP